MLSMDAFISFIFDMSLLISLIMLKKSFLSQCEGSNLSSHSGISILISLTGNSLSTCLKISSISSSPILNTSNIWTVTSYFSSISFFKFLVSGEFGLEEFKTTIKGLFMPLSSFITLSSGST